MPRLRIERLKCVACRHYREEGIVNRCYVPSNVYVNWLGNVFKLPPEKKNYNGRCEHHEEVT
jgi:hypothetical protein